MSTDDRTRLNAHFDNLYDPEDVRAEDVAAVLAASTTESEELETRAAEARCAAPNTYSGKFQSEVATEFTDNSLRARSRRMITGEQDLGQHRYKSTDTMLPRRHQSQLGPLLQLANRGLVVVDVCSGEMRCGLAFLAPASSIERWVPGTRYIVQVARVPDVEGPDVNVEARAQRDLAQTDAWQLGKNRWARLNEFPRRHLFPLHRLCHTPDAFKMIWRTMILVFIWEDEPADDLAALIAYVAAL